MSNEKKPLLSDEFLTEAAEEINKHSGFPELQAEKNIELEETQ